MKSKNHTLSLMLSLILVIGAINTAYSALPKEVQADLLNNKIVKALKDKNYRDAYKLFQQYDALEVKMPPPLVLQRAIAAYHLNEYLIAQWELEKYFDVAERGSKSYNKALALYQDVEPLAEEEAKNSARAKAFTDAKVKVAVNTPPYTNSIGMALKRIPAGSFYMGSKSGSADESPRHKVRINKKFQMGVFEVTVGQFKQFIVAAGRDDLLTNNFMAYNRHNDHPVVMVSWDDAQAFIGWINKKEGDNAYRLPTEAEWEYAARTGTTSEYSWGDSDSQADAYAWYSDNSGGSTQVVGGKRANPWGLYDMHGNAWEWVQNRHGAYYDKNSLVNNPQGTDSDRFRVIRGGSWSSRAWHLRSAGRGRGPPSTDSVHIGFRLVRQP